MTPVIVARACACAGAVLLGISCTSASAQPHPHLDPCFIQRHVGVALPPWLPRYELGIRLDVDRREVSVIERVTWINRHNRPTSEVIFNAHSHYHVPKNEIGLLAKTLEILRMSPTEAMSFDGPPLHVKRVTFLKHDRPGSGFNNATTAPVELTFSYAADNNTALEIALPREVGPGESVTIELEFLFKLAQKKGRWGQWNGVTTMAQWLPVLAVYNDKGWHPTPFIPWHLPFYNEAGIYTARIALPADQKLACSSAFASSRDLKEGWREIETAPQCLRDFALISCNRFEEHSRQVGDVTIRCLALPEHAFYGEKAVQIVAEACFGWNGNQCGGLVMIDERMFNMPHMTSAYLDYLISHEFCHQWWYNAVGNNGYAETWMSEGMATYFSHRLMDQKVGRNNNIIKYPEGLGWLPNIGREDFRNYGYLGVQARGDAMPTVQDMPKFKHFVNLSAMTYDRGSKVVGMIEQRLGEAAFLDFMRIVYEKYKFRILLVADFQKELEAYTGRSWNEFFQDWLFSVKNTDWALGKVEVAKVGPGHEEQKMVTLPFGNYLGSTAPDGEPVRVRVWLQQRGEISEPTVLGFQLAGQEGYSVRVPISAVCEPVNFSEVQATLYPEGDAQVGLPGLGKQVRSYKVEITLPSAPTQITIDPDRVLLDSHPTNNSWKPEVRVRATPLYTQLDEVDVTNSFDRWNVILGPWLYANAYQDPWFVRSPIIGAKAGVYRTQEFDAGVFTGYRTNDSTIVAGAEAYWDHFPLPHTQVGFIYEKALETLGPRPDPIDRGVLYLRYVLMYGSSLYLNPFEYVEAFAVGGNRSLPQPCVQPVGSNLFNDQYGLGVHYHKMLETPYWDPEGGIAIDASYQYGFPIFGADSSYQQVYGQVSAVKYLPEWFTNLSDGPVMSYLKDTRVAGRLAGAAAVPNNGMFFTLSGGDYFRGYDLSQRQGSMLWVGSVEWRMPLAKDVNWDFCDHVAGVRNIYVVPFYDVGNAYVNNHADYGPAAQAVGVGLRVDVAWLRLIERTMLRLDVAKTVNDSTPFQFWVGICHPF